MILLASEVYRLNIRIGLNGDEETKKKLTAIEKMAEKTKKKLRTLDKIKVSPSVKLKDNASSAINKIKSKTKKLSNITVIIKIKAKDEATKTINKIQSKINSFIKAGAKKVISIGATRMMAVVGAGIGASVKAFSEYEQGLSNIKAVTEATDTQIKQLGDTAKSLGSSTAWSAVQVVQAEELLVQAGFSVQETITALPGLLSLASAGGLDLAAATDIVSGTLRGFNLNASESSHVADVLTLSASATSSDITGLGESMKYAAPVAQSLGISLEDTAAATGLLFSANIKGSQSGIILSQTMEKLASPTKEAAGLMKKYGISAFDAKGNMKPLSGVVDNLNKSLDQLTNKQRDDVISTIFGAESMSGVLALMNQGGESLSSLSQKLKDAKGSADKMAETKFDNLAGQWEQLKGAVQTMQTNIGERLAPYAKEFVTWLTQKMPEIENKIISIVDYLSKNTTTIKSIATAVVGLGVAFTGLSAVGKVGNAITGIKGLSSALKGAKVAEKTTEIAGGLKNIGLIGRLLPKIFGPVGLAIAGTALLAGTAITANANLMKKSLSTTTEELGPIEKIMNKLNGTIYKSKSEMQKLGLIYEDFSGNISDTFKKKVEESTKSLHEFQFYLNKINFNGVIDKNESAEFDRRIESMFQSAIDTINENKQKYQASMKEMFMDDGNFSEAEQTTIEYLTKNYDNQISAEEKLRDDIYNIKKDAIKNHGKLLDEDIKQIEDKLLKMSQIELEAAGGTKDELLYAKNKVKARLEKADLKDSSLILQESRKDIDNREVEVKAKYDTNLDKLKAELANPDYKGDRSKLKQTIEQNTKAKEDKLSQLNKEWQSYIKEAYKTNSQLDGQINKYDGTVLTGEDKKSQNSLEKIKSNYKDLNKITQSGFYGIKNEATKAMDTVYFTVDQGTGDITGAWNATARESGAYTNDMKQEVKELGDVHQSAIGGAIKSLADMGAKYDANSKSVVSFSGITLGELGKVTDAADETTTGILNLNGTPIQITSNAEGQIISIQEFKGSVDSISPTANVKINSNANEEKAPLDGLLDRLKALGSKIWTAKVSITEKIFGTSDKPKEKAIGTSDKKEKKAIGTSFSDEIFSTVDERGWELSDKKSVPILGGYNGDPLTYMSRGTKILNHMQSVQDMREEVSRQVNQKVASQPRQIQYQLVRPQQQVQVAGVGGVSFGDVNLNVDGNQDVDNIVAQAVQEFAYKLKESLKNIKK